MKQNNKCQSRQEKRDIRVIIGNPAYPLELFQRVITVSLETMKIVRHLPKLEMREIEDTQKTIH
ncbi:hypothetical protein BWD121_010780 [Bartonella sp. WD12.1]|nr:hypothetical protein BWD121_008550 [Bartonella sp. WD12.1]OPB30034.1 hypothetical protein BWD121_010780 [Bartonella sp. WD12.1]